MADVGIVSFLSIFPAFAVRSCLQTMLTTITTITMVNTCNNVKIWRYPLDNNKLTLGPKEQSYDVKHL